MTDWTNLQLPDPDILYQHLNTAFSKLDDNTDKIPGAQHQAIEAVGNARRQLKRADGSNWTLVTNPYLVFDLESDRDFPDGNGQVRLGGNIRVEDGDYLMFSSSLILAIKHPEEEGESLPSGLTHCCVENGKDEAEGTFYHILERVHWDIDTGAELDERKPMCHVQAGGEISNSAFDDAYEKYHYCSNGLDKPRIPHPPMDPILIFNMLIDQYQSLESFNQSEWTGVVNQGETALWKPYYNATYGMVSSDDCVSDLMQSVKGN